MLFAGVLVFMDQLFEVDVYHSGSQKVKVNLSLVTVVIVHLGHKDTSHLALPDLKSSTRSLREVGPAYHMANCPLKHRISLDIVGC